MAARRNNHPGLADLLDSEARLRARDPTREDRLFKGAISDEEFRTSLKAEEVAGANMARGRPDHQNAQSAASL